MRKLILKAMLLCMMSSFCVGTALAADSDWTLDSAKGKITDYVGPGGDVVVPESISGIPITGFYLGRNENITSLTFPDTITEIVANNLLVLETLHLSNSVSYLFGFDGCPALKSVVIPGTIKTLSGFLNCTALTELILEEGVETVDGFLGCTSLVSVHFPDSVTRIGSEAFSGCTNLTTVRLPDKPIDFGNFPFGATAIKELEICFTGTVIFKQISGIESIIVSDYSEPTDYGIQIANEDSRYVDTLSDLKYLYLPGDVGFSGTITSDCVVESYDNTPGHFLAVDNGSTYVSRGEWEKPTAQVSTPSTSTPSTSTPSTSTPSTGSSSSSSSSGSSSSSDDSNPMVTLAIIGGVVVVLSVGVVAVVMKKK